MITPEQRELRRKYIGSSDLPSICGVDPWSNISDVYLEKTDQLEPSKEKDSGVITIGNSFESAIIDLFAEQQGVIVQRNTPENPLLFTHENFCSNNDGIINPPDGDLEDVEAKSTGKVEEWGESLTDEVPERVLVQVHEQMHVLSNALKKECKVAWVPVLLPGYQNLDFRIYRVERNDDLMEVIINTGVNFWNKHVIPRIPPSPFSPSIELLKRLKRIPDHVVKVPDDLVQDWLLTNQARLDAEKKEKAAKTALIAAMGEADGGEYSEGLVTYYFQNRSGYTVEPTKFPVLRHKKGK